MPYFQKRKYVTSSVNSVLNQSYKNFELIIIYDDNNKNDLNLISKIKNKDKRIKLIINKKNLGVGFSRNIAIKKSKGKFIAFIDSDDLWKKNKLKKQLNFMIKNKYNFSHTSYDIVNNNILSNKKKIAKDLTYQELLKSCDIGLSTVIIKKNLIKKNLFPKLKTKEDFVVWLKIAKQIKLLRGFKEILCSWQNTDNSLSKSSIQKILDAYRVYKFYEKFNTLKSIYSVILLSINYFNKKYFNLTLY
jgi:teichuronic acid biosynthesis glycosyltransferase TuaG